MSLIRARNERINTFSLSHIFFNCLTNKFSWEVKCFSLRHMIEIKRR